MFYQGKVTVLLRSKLLITTNQRMFYWGQSYCFTEVKVTYNDQSKNVLPR